MTDPRADPAERAQRDRGAFRALFEARAAAPFPGHPRARRFFQQLDAWSHPQLVGLLREPAFVATLSPAARERFVGAPLDRFPLRYPIALFQFAQSLFEVVKTRAEYLMEGRFDLPALDLADGVWEPCADGAAAHRAIADYVRSIVELHFGRAPLDWDALGDAFALFASGRLALLAPGTGADDPIGSGLNGEPDSGYFFCFAELALQAAERARHVGEHDDFWWRFARITVVAQEFFLATYAAEVPERTFAHCVRASRKLRPELTLAAMRAHLAAADLPVGAAALPALVQRHAENILCAGRDDFLRQRRNASP